MFTPWFVAHETERIINSLLFKNRYPFANLFNWLIFPLKIFLSKFPTMLRLGSWHTKQKANNNLLFKNRYPLASLFN